MPRAVKSPEATREKILQAAFAEFYRRGYQGGSLNDIIAEARVTKGCLFHHFDGKRALGLAVIEELISARILEHWVKPLESSDDPVGDLKRILNGMTKDLRCEEKLARGCPLNNLAQEMSPLDELFRKRIEKIYALWRDAVAGAFERGLAAGTVRRGVNPERTGVFFVAAVAGVIGAAKNAQCPELLRVSSLALMEYLDTLAA